MSAIAMRIKGKKGLSVVQRGLAVLRKYGSNAHLWLPGVGYFNGQDLGNYLASDGTASASVDNPIGLVLDLANASVGANLVSNGGLTTDVSGWTPVNAPITSNGAGGVTIQKNGASDGQLTQVVSTVVGQSYKISCFVTNPTNNYIFGVTGTNTGYQAVPGRITLYFTASSTSTTVTLQQGGSSGATTTFGQVSLQAISGIPATQATTANKPTLRRGGVNLLTYSNDLTNANWPKSNCTTTPNSVTFTANATAQVAQGVPALPGVPVTLIAKVSVASGTKSVRLKFWDGTTDNYTGNFTATTTPQLIVLNSTGTSFGACNVAVVNGTDAAAGTVIVDGVGFFTGALTASQVSASGGIPLTTSAAASSSGGNWGWQFQAANTQKMTMALATGSSGVLFSAASTTSPTWQAFVGTGGQQNATPGIALAVTNAFQPRILFGSAATSNQGVTSVTSVSPGAPFVASAQWTPTTQRLKVNGLLVGTASNAVDPTSGSTFTLGNFAPGGSDYCNGVLYGIAFINAGSIPASDVLAVERLLATFAGPTGVTF